MSRCLDQEGIASTLHHFGLRRVNREENWQEMMTVMTGLKMFKVKIFHSLKLNTKAAKRTNRLSMAHLCAARIWAKKYWEHTDIPTWKRHERGTQCRAERRGIVGTVRTTQYSNLHGSSPARIRSLHMSWFIHLFTREGLFISYPLCWMGLG